jgi:hypothetical protein
VSITFLETPFDGGISLSLLIWDFPFGYLPTTRTGLFCDSLSFPQFYIDPRLVFYLALGTICRQLCLSTRFHGWRKDFRADLPVPSYQKTSRLE